MLYPSHLTSHSSVSLFTPNKSPLTRMKLSVFLPRPFSTASTCPHAVLQMCPSIPSDSAFMLRPIIFSSIHLAHGSHTASTIFLAIPTAVLCSYPFVTFTTKNYQSFLPVFLPVLVIRNNILVIFAFLVSSLKQEPFNYSLNGMNTCNTETDPLSVCVHLYFWRYTCMCVYMYHPSCLFLRQGLLLA